MNLYEYITICVQNILFMTVKMIEEREGCMNYSKRKTKEKVLGLDNKLDELKQNKEPLNEDFDFDSFIKNAEVILVDNAFDFDINEWEKENQKEIEDELK